MTLRPGWRHFLTNSAASGRESRFIISWYYTIFLQAGVETESVSIRSGETHGAHNPRLRPRMSAP